MKLPQSSQLNIGYFSRLFDNTTNCYKFFWFKGLKGLLKNLEDGKVRITFDDIHNGMIADAWYMVTAYHLQLGSNGSKDNL